MIHYLFIEPPRRDSGAHHQTVDFRRCLLAQREIGSRRLSRGYEPLSCCVLLRWPSPHPCILSSRKPISEGPPLQRIRMASRSVHQFGTISSAELLKSIKVTSTLAKRQQEPRSAPLPSPPWRFKPTGVTLQDVSSSPERRSQRRGVMPVLLWKSGLPTSSVQWSGATGRASRSSTRISQGPCSSVAAMTAAIPGTMAPRPDPADFLRELLL